MSFVMCLKHQKQAYGLECVGCQMAKLQAELDKKKEAVKTLTVFHEDAKKQIKTWTDRWNDLREENRWIPVEEQLPKGEGRVLVFHPIRRYRITSAEFLQDCMKLGYTHWKPIILPEQALKEVNP